MAALVFLACGAFSFHRHVRRQDSLKPRMVPWSLIAMGSLATAFMLAVHIINLLGFETGRR